MRRPPCRSCKPSARRPPRPPLPPAASPALRPPRAASARCRCRRSNGTSEVERETAHLYERVKAVDPAGRVAVLRALCEGDQRAQEGAQRRHPGAQLPDAGNLQLRRRFRRRFAPARARGHQGRRRHHRAVRRALHGRDLEDPQSRQDRADPRPARPAARSPPRSPARTCGCCARNSRACRWSPTSTRRPR